LPRIGFRGLSSLTPQNIFIFNSQQGNHEHCQ
jgi:hypothetical protein